MNAIIHTAYAAIMAIHIAAYALKLGCFFTFDIVTPLVTLQHLKLYKPCVV